MTAPMDPAQIHAKGKVLAVLHGKVSFILAFKANFLDACRMSVNDFPNRFSGREGHFNGDWPGPEILSCAPSHCKIPYHIKSGAALLDELWARKDFFTDKELNAIEQADQDDAPPVSPWVEEA